MPPLPRPRETAPPSGIQTLAVRRLAPFRGVMQLVVAGAARAASNDGWNWEIQVYADRPLDLWASGAGSPQQALFRFGRWSPERGLERVPINPILDNVHIIPAARGLLAALVPARAQLPFPLADSWERWLLDRDGSPLALLASAVSAPAPENEAPPVWHAGAPDSALLEQAVAAAAGSRPRVRWLRRTADGDRVVPESGAKLAARNFPELPLRLPDRRPETATAFAAWQAALAPLLLTLPGLDSALRERLERQAMDQALQVARYWRLYPEIVDRGRLQQALVEARIRNSAAGD